MVLTEVYFLKQERAADSESNENNYADNFTPLLSVEPKLCGPRMLADTFKETLNHFYIKFP